MKRYYVKFLGQVVGVGFRYTLMKLANKYNVTGNVRNRYDDAVEAYLQGEETNIMAIINEIKNNEYFIVVEDYSIKEVEVVLNETGFIVRY